MQRNITRTKNGRFCRLEIRLEDQESGPRLSICGSEGRIVKRKLAKTEALESWTSFFEESPSERHAMNDRFGRNFRSARSAARFVLETDGDFHGLDVVQEKAGAVYILESCGQIRDALVTWFPECKPYLKWHLNDLHAGCEHQDALGWGHGRTVALAREDATQAQLDVLDGALMRRCEAARETEFKARWAALQSSEVDAHRWIREHQNGACSVHDVETFFAAQVYSIDSIRTRERFAQWLRADVARDIVPQTFSAAIYENSIGAPCPTCGYCYGSKWLSRPLPPEVIAWAQTFGEEESDHD